MVWQFFHDGLKVFHDGFGLERKMNFHEDIIGLYLWLIFRDVVRSYGNNDGDLGPIWIQVLKISTSTSGPF